MAKTAQLYDGTILEFPDSTPDSVIANKAKEITQQKKVGDVADFVRSQQGMPPENALAAAHTDTAGADSGELFAAGMGKAVVDAGRGIQQMAGKDVSIPGSDKSLMKTGPGLAGNITGNVSMFAPSAMIPGANTYTASAAIGGLAGALQPTEGNESRSANAATGMIGGVVGRGLVGALSRGANPQTNPNVTKLMDEGVTPTPGQIVGGAGRRLEESLRSVPFLGDGIAAAEKRANQQFNTAAINRVLQPLGRKITGYGQDAIEEAGGIISKTYDDILKSMSAMKPDQKFTQSLTQVRSMVNKLPDDKLSQFGRILKSEVTDKLDGALSPDDFKVMQSELGRLARDYGKSQDFDQRELGKALLELKKSLTDLAARQNPSQSAALRQADDAYSALLRVEDAAARNPTTDGVFSPAQLGMSAKKLDSSLRKRATARGNAPMQELAQSGRDVLGANLPDSGTANRLASVLTLGGGMAINPYLGGSMVAGRMAYSPAGQSMLAAALAKRPEMVRNIGKDIAKLAPMSGIIGGQTAINQ